MFSQPAGKLTCYDAKQKIHIRKECQYIHRTQSQTRPLTNNVAICSMVPPHTLPREVLFPRVRTQPVVTTVRCQAPPVFLLLFLDKTSVTPARATALPTVPYRSFFLEEAWTASCGLRVSPHWNCCDFPPPSRVTSLSPEVPSGVPRSEHERLSPQGPPPPWWNQVTV